MEPQDKKASRIEITREPSARSQRFYCDDDVSTLGGLEVRGLDAAEFQGQPVELAGIFS